MTILCVSVLLLLLLLSNPRMGWSYGGMSGRPVILGNRSGQPTAVSTAEAL